jgi:splicing factor 3B subunit 3
VLDYNTVAGVDKFGNMFTLRLPDDCSDELVAGSSSRLLWDQGLLNGAPNKLQTLTNYYLGEAGTSIVKCDFKAQGLKGQEVILVSTITGGIHAFIPFRTKEEASFYQHLEMFMRQEFTNIVQRDHLSYRSYFQPVKNTIDGDLCEKFTTLSFAKQKEFADDVDARNATEVVKRLEEIRDFI